MKGGNGHGDSGHQKLENLRPEAFPVTSIKVWPLPFSVCKICDIRMHILLLILGFRGLQNVKERLISVLGNGISIQTMAPIRYIGCAYSRTLQNMQDGRDRNAIIIHRHSTHPSKTHLHPLHLLKCIVHQGMQSSNPHASCSIQYPSGPSVISFQTASNQAPATSMACNRTSEDGS